jgi:hypothetical protein
MKIIIDNLKFDFNIGCRLLKTKYDECPAKMENIIGDLWNDIIPMTFQEISTEIKNIEERRIAINCLGIENVVKQVKPRLISRRELTKKTTWVNNNGKLETKKFDDVYELYEVLYDNLFNGIETANWVRKTPYHFVKCKCTSTDREYYIWVDAQSVYRTNDSREQRWYSSDDDYGSKINAIQAIAWTIQTNVPKGNIEKIVRQGDCILIKPSAELDKLNINSTRHLTEEEYKTLLVAES